MKSANRFPFDKALELRAAGLGPVAVDTTTPSYDLGREAPYVHGSDRPLAMNIAVVFVVESLGSPITDETFDLEVLLDDAANLPSPTVISSTRINAPGVYPLLVEVDALKDLAGGNANRFIAARANVAGTDPEIAFYAYLAPIKD